MAVRRWIFAGGLAAVIAAGLLAYFKASRQPIAGAAGSDGSPVAVTDTRNQPLPDGNKAAASVEQVIRVNATNALASVNGRALKLADLMPVSPAQEGKDQEFSAVTYSFLLERAVNRELILQTAKAQGVELDESQREQLLQFRNVRKLPEPGLVERLNVDQTQIDFETRDAEAFMLQTTLLAKAGSSPNVSAGEARNYYDQHIAEFGELPADEPALSQAWAAIDYQIRTRLAPAKRAQFQQQLAAYMDQIKSGADIAMSPAQ